MASQLYWQSEISFKSATQIREKRLTVIDYKPSNKNLSPLSMRMILLRDEKRLPVTRIKPVGVWSLRCCNDRKLIPT